MIELEVFSDVNCPWCYIGKRRLEAALARFEHRDAVDVRWRSFELDPNAPQELPGTGAAVLAQKYGVALEQAREMERNVARVAAGEGLAYDLERARIGSSFDAHRLIHLAREQGLQGEMKERLLRARFCEGRLISDHATLLELAVECGLDPVAVRATLAGDAFSDAVRADELTARELGISGVPTFVFDRSFGVSGAQPAQQLLALLERAWEEADGVDKPRSDAA